MALELLLEVQTVNPIKMHAMNAGPGKGMLAAVQMWLYRQATEVFANNGQCASCVADNGKQANKDWG
jgi:hypothetical protein